MKIIKTVKVHRVQIQKKAIFLQPLPFTSKVNEAVDLGLIPMDIQQFYIFP